MLHSLIALTCILTLPAQAELSREQLEQWFESDVYDSPEQVLVQDEKLRLIGEPDAKPIPVTQKTYRILADSLDSGWVEFNQCIQDLDAVAKAEVVYEYRKLRDLKVTQQRGIEKLWIDGQSIQMTNLSRGASLCSSARVQILSPAGEGRYALRTGPYKRKFLDGYYPMRVSLSLKYPTTLLRYDDISPQPAAGFQVETRPGSVTIDTHFSGELTIIIEFVAQNPVR